MRSLDEFEKKIGYKFKNRSLLITALTHSSYANESRGGDQRSEERRVGKECSCPFFIPFFSSGLALINSCSLISYSRLTLNIVSLRLTLCISLHLATTGPWIAGCVTEVCTVLVGSFSNGMRITCPMRKFSALNPGFASQIALADTLYIVVSLYKVSPA